MVTTKPAVKSVKYPYPSRFGSHASMVDAAATALLTDNNYVVCVDEFGSYTTLKNRLDGGLADPNRYNADRLGPLFIKSSKKDA